MKRILTICCVALSATATAQLVVYDPVVHSQEIIDQVENLAKYVEMIENQVQQINTLTEQLGELQKYNEAFGNPASLLRITGVNGLVQDLRRTELGQAIEQVQRVAQGVDALTYDAGGIYHNVGRTFKTPGGDEIEREAGIYRPNAAIQRSTQNYTNVFDDVRERRRTLKNDIAATTEALQSASTASEVQKLTGVLIGLNAELAATDKEVDHALSVTLAQQAENENDRQKQIKARAEEQKAEFTESLRSYRRTFQPVADPAIFPEGK
jgi:uncharacterized phage infection (PIP) family protein YhgE